MLSTHDDSAKIKNGQEHHFAIDESAYSYIDVVITTHLLQEAEEYLGYIKENPEEMGAYLKAAILGNPVPVQDRLDNASS